MGEWTPVVGGYGFLAVLLVAFALFPRSWWAVELSRRYGIRPSGPFGTFTRRDHFLRAAVSALAAMGCLGASLLAFRFVERIPEANQWNQIASVYFFGFFLLAGVASLAGLIALFQGIFYRSPSPPAPLTVESWLETADFLERLTVRPVPEPEWVRFSTTRHADPIINQVRVACVEMSGGNQLRFQRGLRTRARAWAKALRSNAL